MSYTTERATHEVIEKRLLLALEDEASVAAVLNKEDLLILIKALAGRPEQRAASLLEGFQTLRREVGW